MKPVNGKGVTYSTHTSTLQVAKGGDFTRESQHNYVVTLASMLVVYSLPSFTGFHSHETYSTLTPQHFKWQKAVTSPKNLNTGTVFLHCLLFTRALFNTHTSTLQLAKGHDFTRGSRSQLCCHSGLMILDMIVLNICRKYMRLIGSCGLGERDGVEKIIYLHSTGRSNQGECWRRRFSALNE